MAAKTRVAARTGEALVNTTRFSMRTFSATPSDIEHRWYIVDAEGQILGRLASEIASVLKGKRKATYTPHLDVGDHVIVVNAEKIHVTGRKRTDKMYRWHSGYIGGLREVSFEKMIKSHPDRVIEWAVQGMLPKNRLGRAMAKKLKVYRGKAHPHEAQQPQALPAARGGEGR